MTPDERLELIERYRDGFRAIAEALDRVGPRHVDRPPAEGWSPREVVHHVADAELFRSVRLRQLLAQDEPLLQAYDEQQLAARLHYERDIGVSMALTAALMDANIALLAALSENEWSRAGRHEELGYFSVEIWLQRAANHAHEHARQILSVID